MELTDRKCNKFIFFDDFPFFRQVARWIEDFRFRPRDRIHVNCINIWHKICSFWEIISFKFYVFCVCVWDLKLDKNKISSSLFWQVSLPPPDGMMNEKFRFWQSDLIKLEMWNLDQKQDLSSRTLREVAVSLNVKTGRSCGSTTSKMGLRSSSLANFFRKLHEMIKTEPRVTRPSHPLDPSLGYHWKLLQFMAANYRPQTKFAKVMIYTCLSFCPRWGGGLQAHTRGGLRGLAGGGVIKDQGGYPSMHWGRPPADSYCCRR